MKFPALPPVSPPLRVRAAGSFSLPGTLAATALGFLSLMAGPAEAEPYSGPGLESRVFLYEKASFPSCHASTVAETPGGLVAGWFGGTDEGNPDVAIYLSRRSGSAGAWTPPEEVANGDQPGGGRVPCWNPVLWQTPGGPLTLYYKAGPTPQTWWGMRRVSTDHGKTWGPAIRLPDGILGPIKNKPVLLPDQTLLCPSSSETPEKPSLWRVHFERTADGGETWTSTGPVHDGKDFQAIQPSILFTGGQRLLALGRTRQGNLFQTESPDLGRTWGPLTASSLPNPNSGTDALTLKDGRHLLIYNHTAKGRSPLNLSVSRDGKTWEAALVLENEPGEYSYPAIIQTADGKVHATWTWKREKVRHAVIDPDKLQPRPLAADARWPERE